MGVIGLGLMGAPMARHLSRAGATVLVHNRSPGPVTAAVADGLIAAPPADMATRCDAIILMVSDTPAVQAILQGTPGDAQGVTGLFGQAKPDTFIVDMGTTSVSDTKAFAKLASQNRLRWIDAPVSGGQLGAIEATLSIMVGGADADVAAISPVLRVLGQRITHVGPAGSGQIAKAANQAIVGMTIGAVAEALALAKSAGADPGKVRQALEGGFAWSRVMELHGARMVSGDFAPGGKVTTQHKDMVQAATLAEALGLNLPALQLNRELYGQLIEQGHGGLDHSALFRLFDRP